MAEALILEFEGYGVDEYERVNAIEGPPARADWLDLQAHHNLGS